MLGRLVSEQLRRGRRAKTCWGNVAPILKAADGVIANLECAITRHDQPWRRTPKVFHFGADPLAIKVLEEGNIRAVSLANNHILDFEVAGLMDTLALLDRAGIAHAGAGRSENEAFAPAWFKIGDLNIALFAVTDNEPSFSAPGAEPGTAYVNLSNSMSGLRPEATEIEKVRAEGADLVILSCHLGPNMVLQPSTPILNYRHTAVDRGIDIVYGHSAHVVQGVERVGHSLILHDTGDFLDDYAVDPELRNDLSFVSLVETEGAHLRRLSLLPVALGFAEVRLAKASEAEHLYTRMTELSTEFGTSFSRSSERLELDLAQDS